MAREWDYNSVRSTLDEYERHLMYVLDHIQSVKQKKESDGNDDKINGDTDESTTSDKVDELLANIHPNPNISSEMHKLLQPSTVAKAMRALHRTKLSTNDFSTRIRSIEKLVGLIGWTPLTEELSYRLLEANSKAGNVKRALALLELRRRRGYVPREQDPRNFQNWITNEEDGTKTPYNYVERGEKEFILAITAIKAAQAPLRSGRNIHVHESTLDESTLDNPTRYLDAILLNMSPRGVPLRQEVASPMLSCYASTGRTGRAMHYFYRVIQDPIESDGSYIPGPCREKIGGSKSELIL